MLHGVCWQSDMSTSTLTAKWGLTGIWVQAELRAAREASNAAAASAAALQEGKSALQQVIWQHMLLCSNRHAAHLCC